MAKPKTRASSEAQMVLYFSERHLTVWLFADGMVDFLFGSEGTNPQMLYDVRPWTYYRNTDDSGKGWAESSSFALMVPIVDAAFEALKEEGGG